MASNRDFLIDGDVRDPSTINAYFRHPIDYAIEVEASFEFYRRYIDEIIKSDFDCDLLANFEAVYDKLLKALSSYFPIPDDDSAILSQLSQDLVINGNYYQGIKWRGDRDTDISPRTKAQVLAQRNDSTDPSTYQMKCFAAIQKQQSHTARLYNSFSIAQSTGGRQLELYGLYTPDDSNKRQVEDLIDQAISLIKDDETLTRAAKQRLVSRLNVVLKELRHPRTNWTRVFGVLKETVIVLGALGSLTGGICGVHAMAKLNEANNVIENTSIHNEYILQQDNRIIVDGVTIITNNTKLLPDNTEKNDGREALEE